MTELIVPSFSNGVGNRFGVLHVGTSLLRVTCENGHELDETTHPADADTYWNLECINPSCRLKYRVSPKRYSVGSRPHIMGKIYLEVFGAENDLLGEWIKYWFGPFAEIEVSWKS